MLGEPSEEKNLKTENSKLIDSSFVKGTRDNNSEEIKTQKGVIIAQVRQCGNKKKVLIGTVRHFGDESIHGPGKGIQFESSEEISRITDDDDESSEDVYFTRENSKLTDSFFVKRIRDDSFEEINTQNSVLIAKVHQFSDESIHRPGEGVPFNYTVVTDRFREISLHLFANGINSESQGYVSLSFRLNTFYFFHGTKYLEISYTVGVIDSSGNKRLLRSFIFPLTDNIGCTYDIDRYIERETLLSEPLDFLPGDCLNLHIDAEIKVISADNKSEMDDMISAPFTTQSYGNERRYYLSLDSAVAERLKKMSTYFQRMSESAMKETRTGCMEVPADEYDSFANICNILMGSEFIQVRSLHEICQMYILSDKYDIPAAMESSRFLVSSFLRVKNDERVVEHVDESIPELLELAERFNDVHLKEIVERFSKFRDGGAESGNSTREDIQVIRDTEWEVEFGGEIRNVNTKEGERFFNLKKHQQESEFSFYQ